MREPFKREEDSLGLLLLPGRFNARRHDVTYDQNVLGYRTQGLPVRSLRPHRRDRDPGIGRLMNESGLSFTGKTELDARAVPFPRVVEHLGNPREVLREAGRG